MKRIIALFTIVLFLSQGSSAFALSLELRNESKWNIHELYFSPTDEEKWGPDQLEDEVIETDEAFKLSKITKGDYDVKIVDEDGDSCEIKDVDFRSSEVFKLTDNLLLGCQAATTEEHEEDEK